MGNRWIVGIGAVVLLLVGGLAGWAIASTSGGDHMMGDSATMMDGVSETHHGMMAMDDKAFLATMVAHHEGALEMARAEIQSGTRPAVKALAQRVVAAQEKEIAQMRAWYRALYGEDVPPADELDMGDMSMMGMSGMDGSAISGAADPDEAFLRMMIPHHAGAILMADMVLNGTPDPRVKRLAEAIIADQSAEIAEMQELRATT